MYIEPAAIRLQRGYHHHRPSQVQVRSIPPSPVKHFDLWACMCVTRSFFLPFLATPDSAGTRCGGQWIQNQQRGPGPWRQAPDERRSLTAHLVQHWAERGAEEVEIHFMYCMRDMLKEYYTAPYYTVPYVSLTSPLRVIQPVEISHTWGESRARIFFQPEKKSSHTHMSVTVRRGTRIRDILSKLDEEERRKPKKRLVTLKRRHVYYFSWHELRSELLAAGQAK